jgi:glutamate N-acetyltransferase/amino-acid N-acetyltransferase
MKWPQGVRSAGVASGIKSSGTDLGLIVLDEASAWAGTFTQNAAAAAPVQWSKSLAGGRVKALIVNSGNANACTGSAGEKAVKEEVAAVAGELGCDPTEVLVASTGPIGIPLPVGSIVGALGDAVSSLGPDSTEFATSILTTDTYTKTASATAGSAGVVGVAKGAAMLAPNMATMLAFIATDADVDAGSLQKALDVAVDVSFNRITVDACESTNDSVFMFATGASPAPDMDSLVQATVSVCKELALAMVRDAEGGTKLMRIAVHGAESEADAVSLARAVASSALWKAAAFGSDPNWGRIVSALGSESRSLDLARLEVTIGDAVVFSKGEPAVDLTAAGAEMNADEIAITCRVGDGPGSAEFLSPDLTPDYVTLNATGTT